VPRDQVFISYSHEDTKWREDFEKHLKPYFRAGSIKSWSDQQISPGSEWLTQIKTALTNTKVAVLLVTSDFIASDFIHEYELGPLLNEAKQGGVRTYGCLFALVPTKRRRLEITKLFLILPRHWPT